MRAIREWLANQLLLVIKVLAIVILSLGAGLMIAQQYYSAKLDAESRECWERVMDAQRMEIRLREYVHLIVQQQQEQMKYMKDGCDPNDPNK